MKIILNPDYIGDFSDNKTIKDLGIAALSLIAFICLMVASCVGIQLQKNNNSGNQRNKQDNFGGNQTGNVDTD